MFDDPDLGLGDEEEETEITQEDCWTVISSFFEEKGLVRQQLDSFDEFVHHTMQELIDEAGDLTLEQQEQHSGLHGDVMRRYELKWGQVFLARPTVTEMDGSVVPVFPQEARLRNLTYSSPIYLEVARKFSVAHPTGDGAELNWVPELEDKFVEGPDNPKVWIGKVRLNITRLRLCLISTKDAHHGPLRLLLPVFR